MRRIIIVLLFVLPLNMMAQKNLSQTEKPSFRKAKELFEMKKYATASIFFDKYLRINKDPFDSDFIASSYYKAYCDVVLHRASAERHMEDFIKEYPNTYYSIKAQKLLAYTNFGQQEYTRSLNYFKGLDENSLKGDEKAEFLLKRAYALMINKQTKQAANDFYAIDSKNEKYKPSADFYYANIAFREGNYQTALQIFEKLEANPEFTNLVPYYIIQVYYMQRKFDKLIELGSEYYDKTKGDRRHVLSRILANAYFNKEDFKQAEKYYSIYLASTPEAEKIDNYEYGYSLYKLGRYDEAITYLEKIGAKDDLINQAASYCLADCYIKTNKKESARKALAIAASLDFDKEIQESALFNMAKINYELSYSPFNETLNAFDDYITKYPDSRRSDEAYDYLVKVYLQTRDYQASLNSMDKIKVKTMSIKMAYQRVSYYRGIQVFNKGDYAGAIKFFDASLEHASLNNIVAADCIFWKAEAYYSLGDYKKSITLFDKFLLTPGASLTDNYARAYYALAYSYYQTQEYSKAINNFKSFELQEKDESSPLLSDARCRIVDYYLFQREYEDCITYCNKLINRGASNTDYALLKKSLAYNLLGNSKSELESLNKMLSSFPESEYYSEACYMAGNAAMALEDNASAKGYFNKILAKNKSYSYDAMAKLQLALIAYNEKNLPESQSMYKSVIADYVGTDYAVAAKSGLKNVMVEINDVDNYYAYIKEKGMQTNDDSLAKDSLVFAAAEKLYMDNNLKEAIPAFKSYISANDKGDFILTANYYLADAYYRDKQKDNSLPYYEKVLSAGDNTFTLNAALHAAEINKDNKAYAKAVDQFAIVDRLTTNPKDKLYAKWKMLEGNFALENYQACIKEGSALLASTNDIKSIKYDIQVILSKAYFKIGDKADYMKYNALLAKDLKRKEGAEAKYIICKSLYDERNYSQAEKEINDFMESESTQYFYLAKSFMLLSDIFLNKNDKFQAKYTLMSIVENYPNTDDGVLDEAKRRLDALQDKQELKEDSIKKNNAATKTKIENADFEKYRNKFDESDEPSAKEKKDEAALESMR